MGSRPVSTRPVSASKSWQSSTQSGKIVSRRYNKTFQSTETNQSNDDTFKLQDQFRCKLSQIGLQLAYLGLQTSDFNGYVLLVLLQLLNFPIGFRDDSLQLRVLLFQLADQSQLLVRKRCLLSCLLLGSSKIQILLLQSFLHFL